LVHHHGATKVSNGLDAAFNGCILMMSTYTAEGLAWEQNRQLWQQL